jgi:hypothetical protein
MTGMATNGYDVVFEIGERALNAQLAEVPDLARSFRSRFGQPPITGRARVRLSEVRADFDVPSVIPNGLRLTFDLAGTALILIQPQAGLVSIEGTIGVTGRLAVRDLPDPPTLPAGVTAREGVLDFTRGPGGGADRVEVHFPPGAPATSASLQQLGVTPTPQILAFLAQMLETAARDSIRETLPVFSVTPGGVLVSAAPSGPATPTQFDLAAIRDFGPAHRNGMGVLLRTCRGPDSSLDPDAFKSVSVPAGADVAIRVADEVVLGCFIRPALAATIPGLAPTDFSTTEPCRLAGPKAIALPGQPEFVLDDLEAVVSGGEIVVTGAFHKNTWMYAAKGTFEIDVDLQLSKPPFSPPFILAVTDVKPVQLTVTITAIGWITAAVVLTLLLPGILGLNVLVVLAIVNAFAMPAVQGGLADTITTALRQMTPTGIPAGPAAGGVELTSVEVDDLTLGGKVTIALPPQPPPWLIVADSTGRPIDAVQPTPQDEGTAGSFEVYVYNRATDPVLITSIALVDDPGGVVSLDPGVKLPLSLPAGFKAIPFRFAPPAAGWYLPELTISATTLPKPPAKAQTIAVVVDIEARALPAKYGRLQASPSPWVWGTLKLLETASAALTVTNVGSADAQITGLALEGEAPPGQLTAPWSWGNLIAPGQSLQLYFSCTPTQTGPLAATVAIDVRGSVVHRQRLTVALSAGVGAPVMVVEPTELDFGALAAGASATRSFAIRNDGDLPLTLAGVARTLGGPHFEPDPAIAFPLTLAPGASQVVDVTWTAGPTPGAPDVNEFEVAGDDPLHPTVRLRCVGATAGPRLRVDPDFVEFGGPPVVPASRSLTVANDGSSPLTVSALRPPRPPFGLSGAPAVPFAVGAAGQTTFTVMFAPTQPGEWTDRIDLTSDDAQHPTIHVGMHGAH